MTCPGCGAPDDQSCRARCPETCQHQFLTHMIEMPYGYSKPGVSRCVKCGTFQQPTTLTIYNHAEIENQQLRREVEAVGKEVCLCAAIKMSDGYIIRGHRHDDCIQTSAKKGYGERVVQAMQGFLTSRGRFVDRKEAAALQKAAGIKSVDANRIDFPDHLFSEDLY